MSNLSSIILPVINDMEESHLKTQLLKHLPKNENEFSKIEKTDKIKLENQITSRTPIIIIADGSF